MRYKWSKFHVFFLRFFFLLGARGLKKFFSHNHKNRYNLLMRNSIALKFNSNKGDIKMDLRTKVGVNSNGIHRIRRINPRKKD